MKGEEGKGRAKGEGERERDVEKGKIRDRRKIEKEEEGGRLVVYILTQRCSDMMRSNLP